MRRSLCWYLLCLFPRPRSLNPRVAPALEAICRKALALEPEARYATAEALKADLERWLADEPVLAWPDPWTIRAQRWVRRHRTLVTSAAAALVFGLAGLAGIAVVLRLKNTAVPAGIVPELFWRRAAADLPL